MQSKLPFETDDHVLGIAEGPYTRYAGLPEDEPRDRTITAITRGIPSATFIKDFHHRFKDTHIPFIYTKDEMDGMRSTIPSTFGRVAPLFPDLFPDTTVTREARMLQAQTELQTRISTSCAAVIHQRREMPTVISKIRHYARICGILNWLGLPIETDLASFGPYTEDRMDDILIRFKSEMIHLYDRVEWPLKPVSTVTLEECLTAQERVKFGYRDWLRDLLGDNLVAIGVYGSSTQTDDPRKYDDYDNWVVVRDMDAAYARLRNTLPKYDLQEHRVVRGKPKHDALTHQLHVTIPTVDDDNERYKHLGILLFPVGGTMLRDYIRFLDDNNEFRSKMKIILRSLELSETLPTENGERGVVQSSVKGKTGIDATSSTIDAPERLLSKNLFEFFAKILRFNYKNAIRYHEGHALGKEELDRRLREEHGIVVPKFRPDIPYLVDQLIYARQCGAYLQRKFFKDIEMKHDYFTGDTPRLRF